MRSNFFDAWVRVEAKPIGILLNDAHPIIAFSDELDRGAPIGFVDHEGLRAAFASFGTYSVLSTADLEKPVNAESVALLADCEVDQLEYWKPTRIGDVIFNFWD